MQPALQDQKQDIVNRLNQVNNILVTVKANPTVDELSAALGLTMALNNYGKHATAVFSGQIPNAMSFLKPQKTFENNVHSLRDFIISLNKEKADKLRFAKDGEIVKIYITPYKSTITPTDLEYSEGDFNVEMVIAIGINVKEELDVVIAAHGRILHEATVATVMPGQTPSQLGSINWSDPSMTSSSAMAVQLLQSLNVPNLISPEVATALLTGVVADTDRFSNTKTSPRIMELAAQLMNSGANHLLVTSSIAASAHPVPASAIPQTGVAPEQPSQDLVLDLHTPTITTGLQAQPAQAAIQPIAQPTPAPATNSTPMVSSPAEQATTQPVATPTIEAMPPQPSPAVAELLPQPTDTSQTILPVNLMPPQAQATPSPEVSLPPISPINTTVESPDINITPTPALTSAPATTDSSGEDQIRSEIDKIYSAEPFNPANNPRQDIATNIALPEQETEPTTDVSLPTNSVDTSVQESQATPALKPIEATRDEAVDPNSILGNSPSGGQPSLPQIPGLEMPPEITPPPPPPNPLVNAAKTSSIDTEPFGNTINFDPTKSTEDAK